MEEKDKMVDHLQEAVSSVGVKQEQGAEKSLELEPYRRELLLHSYRLLGSLHDAEDAVQDTMLRAWRHFGTFTERGPGSLRSWLYTIATNTSLDLLKKRSPRTLPTSASAAWDPALPIAPRDSELLWLEPFPDSWLAEATENPEARYTRHESISLAFLTVLQVLPPRQRAILLLSDVLSFRASEIAQFLEISVSAVNSALHRARVTMEKSYQREQLIEEEPCEEASADISLLLARYLKVWETNDMDGLLALLKEDAILSMPPVPSWYQGREAIRRAFSAFFCPPDHDRHWRLFPTRGNGQLACAVYVRDDVTQPYQAFALQVLTLDSVRHPSQIASLTAFLEPEMVAAFGFPLQDPQ